MVNKILAIIACALLSMGQPVSTYAQSPSISAAFFVDRSATKATDRVVITLTGTYTCGPLPQPQPMQGSTFAGVNGSVSQAAGRDIAEGGFAFTPICDAVEHTFQTNAQADNIPWHGGPARVRASLFVQLCDEFSNCQQATSAVDMQISIRG